MNALGLLLLYNIFVYLNRSLLGYSFSREDNLFFKSEYSAMKIFKVFSIIERQGIYIRLDITIHPSNMRGDQMEKSGYNCPYWYFMSMGVDNLICLSCHGRFFTCVISHFH